jgi:hypothetical protein
LSRCATIENHIESKFAKTCTFEGVATYETNILSPRKPALQMHAPGAMDRTRRVTNDNFPVLLN